MPSTPLSTLSLFIFSFLFALTLCAAHINPPVGLRDAPALQYRNVRPKHDERRLPGQKRRLRRAPRKRPNWVEGQTPLGLAWETDQRSAAITAALNCPPLKTACPLSNVEFSKSKFTVPEDVVGKFECRDLGKDVRSCGGCSTSDSRYDCLSIAGVLKASCVIGTCRVRSCMPGFILNHDGNKCVPV